MVFSSDGKSLTSVGSDHSIRTWDVATGKYLRAQVLEGTADLDASAISLAPDGKTLLVWRSSRNSMVVYDLASGKKRGSLAFGENQPYRATLAPGGKTIAASISSQKGQQTIHLWDVATGTERVLLEDLHHHPQLEFSPDGKFLAVASGTYGLRLCDVATGKIIHKLSVETERLAFSPDSKTVASANFDWTVKLWDVVTGKELATLRQTPKHHVQRLAFSPDAKLLVAAGQPGVRIWDVAAGKVIRQLPGQMISELAFAPDDKLLAASGGSSIRLWDVATGKRLLFRDGHNGEVHAIVPSPNGKVLASTSYLSDGTLCLWDAATGKLLHQPPGDDVGGRAPCFSADGRLIASGGSDGFLHLWEMATGKEWRRFPIESLQREEGPPYIDALRLSPDGKRLAAVARFDRSSQINVWDAATGKLLTCRLFEGRGWEVFTPDGQGITVQVPEGVAIQDTVSGKNLVTIPEIEHLVPIAFSPDGKLVALMRRNRPRGDRTVASVAEVATGKEVLSIKTRETHILAFSADGRILATADENVVRLWEVPSGKEIHRRSRHAALAGAPSQAALTSVAILPGNRALATGMMDGTILVWGLAAEPATAKELSRRELDDLWADLAGDEARKAYRAIQSMELSAAQSIGYLNRHLQSAAEVDAKRVKQLIADLDSDEFAMRQKASKELEKYGPEVEPIFREVLDGSPSLEARKRLQALLERSPLPLPSGEPLRQVRAVAALERIGSPEARKLLQKLAGGAAQARLTREAKAALERLARQ
jgi:WD40 repeat protein